MFKSQSNTKFCNRLYRNLLFNGALTLFYLVMLQMVFILFYVSFSWKLIKSIVWTAHGERHTLSISYFLQIIQNIPIYKIRVESMEQTILLFYRYYILFYYKKNSSATKYHTNPRNARGKDILEHTKRRIKSSKSHYYFQSRLFGRSNVLFVCLFHSVRSTCILTK